MDYEEKSDWTPGENKPNSKPIKANLKRAKMNVNSYSTKDYENKRRRGLRKNKANQSQFQRQNVEDFEAFAILTDGWRSSFRTVSRASRLAEPLGSPGVRRFA